MYTFLGKLMTTENSTISSVIFTAQAIVEPFNISIIQQCKMLEAMLGVQVLGECLQCPDSASMIVRYQKQSLLDTDMSSLVISAKQDNSAQLVAAVAQQISWRKLWDMALDKGIQRIVRHLSRRIYKGYICPLCDSPVDPAITWLSHLCSSHPVTLGSTQLSEQSIVHLLSKGDNQIFHIQFPK